MKSNSSEGYHGFYHFWRKSWKSTWLDYRDLDVYGDDGQLFWCDDTSYDQNFLTAGASIQWRRMHWDLAIMDSSLLSSGDLSQTYFKLGCTLELENH